MLRYISDTEETGLYNIFKLDLILNAGAGLNVGRAIPKSGDSKSGCKA